MRQLKLAAFMRPTTIHTGAWRYPGAFADANFNLAHLVRFAKTLERGLFDAFFQKNLAQFVMHLACDVFALFLPRGLVLGRHFTQALL